MRWPAEKLYQIGDRINRMLKRSYHPAGAKVLSIGNITTGGTGKTPATIYFARRLAQEQDTRPAILSRGYGGSLVKTGGTLSDGRSILLSPEEGGEEPWLLAANLPGIPVGIGRDRIANAERFLSEFNSNLFILDDGFQHYAMSRDVDIVLVDAVNPFGNRHLLPHGILREPPDALSRADIVILTKCNLAEAGSINRLTQEVSVLSGHDTVFRAEHRATGLVRLPADSEPGTEPLEKLSLFEKEEVWAVSAIGSHRSFEKMLSGLGAARVHGISFRDHHQYSLRDAENIMKRLNPYSIVITTEKDWIKLRKFAEVFAPLRNFFFLKMEFGILSNEILLLEGLKAKLMAGKAGP